MKEMIDEVIGDLRSILQADGGDLVVQECNENQVKIEMIRGPAACKECILPPETIQVMVTDLLAARLGHTIQVTVAETG